jgi:ribosome-binding ATPase YchF (GTP1/OBG family)
MGLTEPGASVLIRAAYKLLKQYFTAGVRGSYLDDVNIGSTAPQAAGVIHTISKRLYPCGVSYSYVAYEFQRRNQEH